MKSFAVFALLLIAGLAGAVEPKRFEFPHEVRVYDLPTASNGVAYRLYVRPPLREPAEGERASTIYFLDALRTFTPAAVMSDNYEYFDFMPASYFVGIGYQDESDGKTRKSNRIRDYTPTAFSPPDDNHFLANSPADWQGSGGAEAFLKIVAEDIIPFVEETFEVGLDRVLVGTSTSGLAASVSLLTHPGLFNRYLIVSPALWWDDWGEERRDRAIMALERAHREVRQPSPTRVYFAAGGAETRFGLITDVSVLADALIRRRDPNLKVYFDILDGEQHEGVFPAAFMRGIVGLYAGERRPSATRVSW